METSSEVFDIVVAGAGLGGVFAAAKLAKEGKKVLLLEKHTIPGGYASFFNRRGFRFEASLHAIDGMFGDEIKNKQLFEEFGLESAVDLIRLHEFFRVIGPEGLDVMIPDTVEGAKKAYLQACPGEEAAIDQFFDFSRKMYDQVMGFRDLTFKDFLNIPRLWKNNKELFTNIRGNLGSFMESLTSNHRLKMLIGANASYYHDNPDNYSLVHFMAAQSSYFRGGAAQIRGGSYELVDQMVKKFIAYGGEIRCGCDVTELLVNKKRVSGVVYREVRTGKAHTIQSKAVVGNIPFPVLADLLPAKEKAILTKPYRSFTYSPSIYSLYLGLKKPLSELGITNFSSIILPEEYRDFTTMVHHNYRDNYGERILYLTNYSALDLFPSTQNEPTASLVVLDTMKEWESLSHEEYQKKKELHCNEILDSMERRFPGFRENITYISTASPKTFARYTGNPGGAVYGFAQDVAQLGPQRPKNKTKIPGLYLAGAWSFPGGGMIPAAKSGFYAANELLRDFKKL